MQSNLVGDLFGNEEKHVAAYSGDARPTVASTAIDAALNSLDAEIARLDAIIGNKFADDPAQLAAWQSARRLERAPRKGKNTPRPAQPA